MDKKKNRRYVLRKGDSNMTNFNDFIKMNKDKIKKLAEANTIRNKEGVPVITKDDPWREETEWEDEYRGEY